MGKSRVEGLLALLPKLIKPDQQHNFVETEEVRLVYQPMDSFYLVLITNLGSNVVSDVETVKLLARIIPEYCAIREQADLEQASLELMLAFDEIISMGQREEISIGQLHTILAMESHEEAIAEMVAKTKMQEAKEAAKLKIKQIEMQKKEQAKLAKQQKNSFGSTSSAYAMPPSPIPQPEQITPTVAVPLTQTTVPRAGKGMKLGAKKF